MPLPAIVGATTADYLRRLDETAPDLLLGLYLVGSVALDDFREGASDIDFVAVTREPLDAAMVPRLRDLHEAMRDATRPNFDGFYIEHARLKASPCPPLVVPFVGDGRFRHEPSLEPNPAVWLCLSQHGVVIHGPRPGTLGIALDPAHLRAWQRGNLRSYWAGWVCDCRAALAERRPADVTASTFAWGVLGSARLACTIATGRIVSKSAAGAWALTSLPAARHRVVGEALAARQGEMARVPTARFTEALGFVERIVADFG